MSFRRGVRCKQCGIKKCSTSQRHNYEYVKQYFEDNNCELLETNYINSCTKLKYKCSCGNISYINFTSFKSGRRCKKCGQQKSSNSQSHDYKYVKQYFKENNCELLSTEYKNNRQKLDYKCSCGNISQIKFVKFKLVLFFIFLLNNKFRYFLMKIVKIIILIHKNKINFLFKSKA